MRTDVQTDPPAEDVEHAGDVLVRRRSGKLPKSFNVLNYFNRPERPTRQIYKNMAKQYRAVTKFSSLLPFHMFPKIWNDFLPEIRELEKASIFKHKLRTQMLDNYQREIICRTLDHISSCHSLLPIIDACLFGVILLLFITLR